MEPFVDDADLTIYHGDALTVLRGLADGECDAAITSPPYLDARPEYPSPSAEEFGLILTEMRRVVTGPLLLNVGRLWRNRTEILWWVELLSLAESAGWPVRDTLVWVKPNANPIHGEVFTNSHEYVFALGDSFAVDEVRTEYAEESVGRMGRRWVNGRGVKGDERGDQQGRTMNARGARPKSFVEFSVGKEKGNPHPAPMSVELALYLVRLSGGSRILDPFGESGTTASAARRLGRSAVLIDRDENYCRLAATRLSQQSLLAGDIA